MFFSVPMAIVAVPAAIAVAEGRAEHGRELAQALCSRCHAITASGASPMPQAPPFSEIVRRYPPESLAEALAEGLVTGHPAMPEIRLEPRAIADFLAFLETL
ncbi:MAG: c-type cytochrome [Geminicoccaceae bacterium]|nr:c-type cytochrome [Geminicoccaceae bacterium]MCS7266855.1 c-type cytochrome [Geminicoccaceae bacterium]MCX7628881.1 c-type cytochrome [Geminicoccaceae bacterium]MDW8124222.1 c-type cytochrome [Geminicoccaceae bacterium]MDW8340555.1 c-type cytochrome [Geminicoccaceae bacterium]